MHAIGADLVPRRRGEDRRLADGVRQLGEVERIQLGVHVNAVRQQPAAEDRLDIGARGAGLDRAQRGRIRDMNQERLEVHEGRMLARCDDVLEMHVRAAQDVQTAS